MANPLVDAVRKELTELSGGGRALYLVVDPGRDHSLPDVGAALGDTAECLFTGSARDEFGDTAPWLVRSDADASFLDHLHAKGLGARKSIAVIGAPSFSAVFTHLRKFTKIIDPDGDELFWRFYDPVVLWGQLPFLSIAQREHFFSGIGAVGAEIGENAYAIFQLGENGAIASIVFEDTADGIDRSENVISPVEEMPDNVIPIDVEGAGTTPLLRLTRAQMDGPLLYNRPLLVKEIIENIDEDFQPVIAQIDEVAVHQMISYGISLAIGYRFHDVRHIDLFVDLMFRIAPGWHKQPDLNHVLRRDDLNSAQKMAILTEDSYENAWEQAQDYDDHEEWLPEEMRGDGSDDDDDDEDFL